jgi:hypothetical protein
MTCLGAAQLLLAGSALADVATDATAAAELA